MMRGPRLSLLLSMTAALLVFATATGVAGTLTYRDADGNLHIVDDGKREPVKADAAEPAEVAAEEAPAPEDPDAPEPTCALDFDAAYTKTEDPKRQKLIYQGRVANIGTGRAFGVRMILRVYGPDGKLLRELTRRTSPEELGTTEEGSFRFNVKLRGQLQARDASADELSAEFTSCGPHV